MRRKLILKEKKIRLRKSTKENSASSLLARERGPHSHLFTVLLAFPAHCVRGNIYCPHRKLWKPAKKSICVLSEYWQRTGFQCWFGTGFRFSFHPVPIFRFRQLYWFGLFCIGKWVSFCGKVNLLSNFGFCCLPSTWKDFSDASLIFYTEAYYICFYSFHTWRSLKKFTKQRKR